MKKVLSMLVMLVMVFTLALPASAANSGTITITNATVGQTYSVYRIFDATIKVGTGTESGGVAYSIQPDNQFFEELFGADGTTENTYFEYDSATGLVRKKTGVNDTELTNYLGTLVDEKECTPEVPPITATGEEVTFTNLPYGYYVIDRTGKSVVTIDSSAPSASVIDKNQKPGGGFDKQVSTGTDGNGNDIYANSNTANIGDVIKYKVSFEATNYDGQEKIQYYSIHDTKGEAIWVEFNSFTVNVIDKKNTATEEDDEVIQLKKGYYLGYGDETVNTGEWDYLGDWTGVEKNPNNADWYLVHLGYDDFRITIPWLSNHSLSVKNIPDTDKVESYALNFGEGADSKFASPVTVEVTYTAAVEPNATIGGGASHNLYNTANGSWTTEHGGDSTPPDTVVTKVYGLGLEKKDSDTGRHLAGAQFRLYASADHNNPVYVIPTDIRGVYILDSLGRQGASVTGIHMSTSRELYADYLAGYLGTKTQDNLVETPANGKVVILGLKEGTYYLEEVKAPDGYNAFNGFIEVQVGEGARGFEVYAEEKSAITIEGEYREVADLREADSTFKENTYQLTHTTVTNSTGQELPSTGGAGRTAIIVIGSLLAIGFAILLITHKKMSIYTD